MTENKRFTMDTPNEWGFPITDNVTGKVYSCASNQLMKDLCDSINEIVKENKQLKSTIAQLIEQNRKNNDLLLSDIRILEKALWCSGCANDYGRLKELRKEFMR